MMSRSPILYFSIYIFTYALKESTCLQPPNIIFLIIDDLGWNDVSFHGSKEIPTPNIDALAYDGVILNNYYVQPICTPSRGALMTGKYPIRLGLQHDVIYAEAPWGLSPEEKILPQHLKELGYTTKGIGKWHLGYFTDSYLPVNRGFDSFFGYWNGKEDFYTHFEEGQGTHGLDFHDDNENAWNYTGHYATDLFTSKAIDIINSHDTTKPLFLYLAHQAVHAGNSYTPMQAPPEYVSKFLHIQDKSRRVFAGMVSALDNAIGNLFSALDKAGMLQNSVIVFTTDNGAAVEGIDESTGSNWPLRGSKYNMWEGGIRGTAFVWSPFIRNAKSKVSSGLMHMSDWLPTLYSVAGGDLKKLGGIDGYNLWPTICCNAPSPRNMVLYNIDPVWKVEAIRKDNYKLLKGSWSNGAFDGWFDKEGKKKPNVPFTKLDLKIHNLIYKKLSNQTQVPSVLSQNFDVNLVPLQDSKDQTSEYCYSKGHEKIKCRQMSNSRSRETPHDEENRGNPIEVDCGQKPTDTSSICEPMKASCLFDIVKDPCEYNNLANSLPEIAQDLEGLLDQYRVQSIPIRNQPLDPSSNPKYHGYAWIPWLNKPQIHAH